MPPSTYDLMVEGWLFSVPDIAKYIGWRKRSWVELKVRKNKYGSKEAFWFSYRKNECNRARSGWLVAFMHGDTLVAVRGRRVLQWRHTYITRLSRQPSVPVSGHWSLGGYSSTVGVRPPY